MLTLNITYCGKGANKLPCSYLLLLKLEQISHADTRAEIQIVYPQKPAEYRMRSGIKDVPTDHPQILPLNVPAPAGTIIKSGFHLWL